MKVMMLLTVGLLFSGHVYSEDVYYIRDVLYVPLRSGQGNQFRIVHKGLPSGTPVIFMETSEDDHYTMVRTYNGIEGWLQTQYLMQEPAARDQLAQLNADLAQLKKKNDLLTQQLNSQQAKDKNSDQHISQLSANNRQLSTELERIKMLSGNVLQLETNNQQLSNDNQVLKEEVDRLLANNQQLVDDKAHKAFLNGVFAVLMGVAIALIVPRLWPKKRSTWS